MDKPKNLPIANQIDSKHESGARARPKRPKLTRLHCVILILIITPPVLLALYFAQTRGGKFNQLYTHKHGITRLGKNRPQIWAKPIELPGLPNLYKVSDDLYRGAQPTAEGMRQLKNLGVKTIVNLRLFHSDRNKITGMGFSYQHIPVTAWHPEDGEVVRFLKIATDPNCTPVFVHCQRGAHRAGLMCAVYRIAVQGWSKSEAIDEMTNGDFGFYPGWPNLIGYINKLDIEDIKRRAGSTE